MSGTSTHERATATERQRIALHTIRVDALTAEAVRALTAAGVPTLLLKGPTTARWLYTDGTPRGYGDSDLLVPAALHARAGAALRDLGYTSERPGARQPHEPAHHAVTFYRPRSGLAKTGLDQVDLHRGLSRVTDPRAPVWDVLARDQEEILVGGERVRMPGEAARCLVAALHCAHDGVRGRKALEDLRRARTLVPAPVWQAARALAAELGATADLELGCRLAGHPLCDGRTDWAGAPLGLRLRAINAKPEAQALAGLVRRRGITRLRYGLRRLFPPRTFIAQAYRAHTPFALARGYAHRLWRFAVRVPGAVRDLRAAARPPQGIARPTAKPES